MDGVRMDRVGQAAARLLEDPEEALWSGREGEVALAEVHTLGDGHQLGRCSQEGFRGGRW